MSYKIESYDPQSGAISVTYSSTEEVVSTCTFELPQIHGGPLQGEALEQAIMNRAPVWRLAGSGVGAFGVAAHTTLALGAYEHPIGTQPALADYKAAKTAQIWSFRDALLNSSFTYREHTFSADPISVTRLNSLANLLLWRKADSQTFTWTTAENQLIELSAQDVYGLLESLMQHTESVRIKAIEKVRQVQLATSAEMVAMVEWVEAGVMGGVSKGNLVVTSGPSHQTYETEIAVDRVEIQ